MKNSFFCSFLKELSHSDWGFFKSPTTTWSPLFKKREKDGKKYVLLLFAPFKGKCPSGQRSLNPSPRWIETSPFKKGEQKISQLSATLFKKRERIYSFLKELARSDWGFYTILSASRLTWIISHLGLIFS